MDNVNIEICNQTCIKCSNDTFKIKRNINGKLLFICTECAKYHKINSIELIEQDVK